MSEKVCPLRRVTTRDILYNRVEVDAVFRPCYREKCAWWIRKYEMCAIADIAGSLTGILTDGIGVRS